MVLILEIGIFRNTKCDNLVGFPKPGHMYVFLYLCFNVHASDQWHSHTRATRACALPSTFQALPSTFQALWSPAKQESHDSIMKWTRKQMYYLSCNASILHVCMQNIINLSINTLQLTKSFRFIDCLQNLLEYDGSWDAHLNFRNGKKVSRWKQS